MENYAVLIKKLLAYSNELPWLEFKHDNYDPEMIGQDICALANSATLYEKRCAYMLCGIDNATHAIVGTNYDLQTLKKGNEEIGSWLRRMLSQNADFEYHLVDMSDAAGIKNVGLLTIYKAVNQTVMFQKTDYIRVGSYTKKLHDYPALQAQLWDRLRNVNFEEIYAKQDLTLASALQLIDYSAYFTLLSIPTPSDQNGIAHYLDEDGLLAQQDNGMYAITNLGAILFAKKLSNFPRVARKAVRIVQYKGANKLHTYKDDVFTSGYAVAFESIMRYISALIPTQEHISAETGLRETQFAFPMLSIREAIANALIHQDFSITGAGPIVEMFDHRIEITNPGQPLVDIQRIIDDPPRSRNERLAALMRRLGICEELGSGWDKMVIECELTRLPAPQIHIYDNSTKVMLFDEMPFSSIPPEEKIWACYLHACILHVQGDQLTNKSLRERFGLPDSSISSSSRLIKDTVAKGFIKPLNPNTAPRYMRYVPFWA